jgi:hypothetical protein
MFHLLNYLQKYYFYDNHGVFDNFAPDIFMPKVQYITPRLHSEGVSQTNVLLYIKHSDTYYALELNIEGGFFK